MATSRIHLTSRKRWVWVSIPLALMATLAAAWWMRGHPSDGQVSPASTHGGQPAWPTASATSVDEPDKLMFSKEPVGEARPADVNQPAWDTLNSALANAPNKEQERNRIVSYLRFQRAVAKWGDMSSGPATPERVELARQVINEMPSHVANGEINPSEAMAAVMAMASDVEPDEGQRAAWIEAQRARLQSSSETPAQAKAMQAEQDKVKEFERQKAEITARWMSSPEASRDPAALASQLQALRERTFGTHKP